MKRIVLASLATLTLLGAGCSAPSTPEKKPADAAPTQAATSATPTQSAARQSSGKVQAAKNAEDPINCSQLTEAEATKLLGTPMTKASYSGMGVGKVVEGNTILQSCAMSSTNGQTLSYSIVHSPNAKSQLEKAIAENEGQTKVTKLDVGEGGYSMKIMDNAPTMSYSAQGDYSVNVQVKSKDAAAEDAAVLAVQKDLLSKVKS